MMIEVLYSEVHYFFGVNDNENQLIVVHDADD